MAYTGPVKYTITVTYPDGKVDTYTMRHPTTKEVEVDECGMAGYMGIGGMSSAQMNADQLHSDIWYDMCHMWEDDAHCATAPEQCVNCGEYATMDDSGHCFWCFPTPTYKCLPRRYDDDIPF